MTIGINRDNTYKSLNPSFKGHLFLGMELSYGIDRNKYW